MKQTDFRLGNLIMYDRVVNKIASLNTSFDTLDIETPQGNIIHTRLEFIKRIPISTEWLEKLGFERLPENDFGDILYAKTNYSEDYTMVIQVDGNYFYDKELKRRMHYIDDLQNLYFYLSFEELEIVSP